MSVARGLMATGPFRWIGGAIAGAGAFALIGVLFGSFLIAFFIVVILALLIWIFLLWRQTQEIKASKEIEKTITRQADVDIQRSSPGKLDEMRGLKEGLLAAIASLKSSKATGRGGKGALYALPWYMLIGPPESGKGTFVRRSGLHFPLVDADQHPRAVRGVGGTRSFEWWLSQEAVLLDMRGRTLGTVGLEDADDWHAFLQVLRKQRKAKPLNGLIVTVPLEQIADQTEAQVATLGRNSRERLQELIHHLHTIFPVYVVFTKCDRVAGFSEFFSHLDSAERNQPWGATISVERSRADAAEQLFDEEFGILLSALSDRRMALFSSVPDPGQRSRVFTFPLQLESTRANTRRFLRALFEAVPGEENPIFRGFYFTSAVQEGAPIDRVLDPVLQSMGAAAPIVPPRSENGSYFIQDLLRRVIFPDANLAMPSTRAEAGRRTRQLVGLAILGILFLTAFIGSLFVNGWSRDPVRRTRDAAANVLAVSEGGILLDDLGAMDRLRESVAEVDSFARRRPVELVYYSGGMLVEPATQFYAERVKGRLLSPAAETMAADLAEWNATNSGSFLDYYNRFAAWRLLARPSEIQSEDARLLAREVDKALEKRMGPTSTRDQKEFRRLIWKQLEFLSDRHRLSNQMIATENHALVEKGVERIANTWDSNQFFGELMLEANGAVPDVSLEKVIDTQEMLHAPRPVEGPFTREGYESAVKPRIAAYGRRVERDGVVTEAFQSRPRPNLVRDLNMAYASAYSDHWIRFLGEVSVQQPTTLQGSEELLRKAANPDKSPILQLVREVGRETTLGEGSDPALDGVRREFRLSAEMFDSRKKQGSGLDLKRSMGKLLSLGKDNLAPKDSEAERYVDAVSAAADHVHKANEPNSPASEMTKLAAYGDDANNPIRGLRKLIRDLQAEHGETAGNAAVARVLELPLYVTAGSACDAVKQSIQDRWTQEVVEPFRKTLEGRYPMSAGGTDAFLPDFSEFFQPGGIFWTFYQTHLQKYLTETGEAKEEEGTKCFSPEFTACIRQAYEIREAFFQGGAQQPSLQFRIKASPPLQGGGLLIYGTSFDVGNEPKEYKMGVRTYVDVKWPGSQPEQGAWVRLLTGAGAPQAQAIGASGPFGLFRLLDRSTSGPGDERRWTTTLSGTNVTIVYEVQPGSAHHPFRPDFLRFSLPTGP
jgi:type VI secretion system protein ImpL